MNPRLPLRFPENIKKALWPPLRTAQQRLTTTSQTTGQLAHPYDCLAPNNQHLWSHPEDSPCLLSSSWDHGFHSRPHPPQMPTAEADAPVASTP